MVLNKSGAEITFNKTKSDDCGKIGLDYFNGVNQLENEKYKR